MHTQLQKARKKYSKKQFIEFDKQAVKAAANLKRCEVDLIKALTVVYTTCTHRYFKFTNLYEYAQKCLDLSRSQAYSYVAVTKSTLECEELEEAVLSGDLSVSKATRILSVIDKDNAREWVNKAKELTRKELEKQIANENPTVRVWDHFRFVGKDLIHMQAGINEACFEKIKRTQELMAKKQKYRNRHIKVKDVLNWCLDELLERHDPVIKAERVLRKYDKREKAKQRQVAVKEELSVNPGNNQTNTQAEPRTVEQESNPPSAKAKKDTGIHRGSKQTFARAENTTGDHGSSQTSTRVEKSSDNQERKQVSARAENTTDDHGSSQTSTRVEKSSDNQGRKQVSARAENTTDDHGSNQVSGKTEKTTEGRKKSISSTCRVGAPLRKPLPVLTRHKLYVRDKGLCQYKLNENNICGERRYLDIHHIHPLSHGGSDEVHNLMTICKAHHQLVHS